jgi:2-alkenal reductase
VVGGPQFPYRPDWLPRPEDPAPAPPVESPEPAPPLAPPSSRPLLLVALIALLAGLIGGGIAGFAVSQAANGSRVSAPNGRQEPAAITRVAVQEESAITDVVKAAMPGVVTIINDQKPRTDDRGRPVQDTATGSGFIIDERGYIVTNEHVIRDAQRLRVLLSSGEERPAVLVSDDRPFNDIAVLKIQDGGLTALPVGDSDALTPGQRLVSIGNSLFEFPNTVTVGVVSGLHRRWAREGYVMEDLIQTDAAINHGNSGSPLLNLKGEVVGMNTTVIRGTDSGQNVEGIALALSSRTFAPVVAGMIENGHYPRPYVGVVHRDLDVALARANNLPVSRGAIVLQVAQGSPADRAGIRQGDIIVKVGDLDLNDEMPYINALMRVKPDQRTTFVVNRGGREMSLDVVVTLR